jgi:DNA replication protein DnaC
VSIANLLFRCAGATPAAIILGPITPIARRYIVNAQAAAQAAGRLKRELTRYLKPALLVVDELGYLPIDKHGADLLFQIISQRYERAPMVITTNRVYKHWSQIFNNDSTLTSAILDRVLHHAETVIIEGKSFRMKDEIDE